MSNVSSIQGAVDRLASQADAVGRLANDTGGFAAVVAAFESKDANAFRWVLERLEMFPYCELICEWVRVKLCVLRCIEVCGPPRENQPVPSLEDFAHAAVRLSSNEELLRRVVDAVGCGDASEYQAAINKLELGEFCHLICQWVCTIGYRRVCELVCRSGFVPLTDPAGEIAATGKALAAVVANKKALEAISKSAVELNCEILKATIDKAGFLPYCEIICRFICIWRRVWVCRTLCQDPPAVLTGLYAVEEAQSFALAARQLAAQPRALADLVSAVLSRNAEAYRRVIAQYGLGRYCWQVCGWVTSETCHEYCYCVCPNNYLHPWFTHVGDFSITADINTPGTGLTLHPVAGHGGPNFAFFNCLSLRGFCPKVDPAHAGADMAYRFLYQAAGAGAPTPITGGFVCDVLVGSRYTLWHGNPNAIQSVRIRGTGVTSPTPPPFTPAPAPPDHYIVPDPEGWVPVDQNALDDGFDGWLMGFESDVAFPGGAPAPGVPAGTTVLPTGVQRNGVNAAIIFQATRISTIPAVNGGAAPDYTNQIDTIHINNWMEVNELNFAEFAAGCCTPIDKTLSVEFTVDHEQMGAGTWSLEIDSCGGSAPGVITPPNPTAGVTFTAGGRGAAGTIVENTSKWVNCSYQVWLKTTPGLTTGLIDRTEEDNLLTFAICGH